MSDELVMTVQVRPTGGDYDVLQSELMQDMKSNPWRRVLVWVMFVMHASLVAAGAQAVVALVHTPVWLAVLVCFYPVSLVYSAIERACAPLMHRAVLDPRGIFLLGFEARIESEALRLRGTWGEAQYRWPAILRIRETISHILVYVDRVSAVFIPKSGFSSREEAEAFADALRAKCDKLVSCQP
jgi:hypothetical protein